jgi:hypothetical protein
MWGRKMRDPRELVLVVWLVSEGGGITCRRADLSDGARQCGTETELVAQRAAEDKKLRT